MATIGASEEASSEGLIEIRGLRVMAVHGVLAEERASPQPFELDLRIRADLTAAAASDQLLDTVDYGEVVTQVRRLVATEQFDLLERLADQVARLVLLLGSPRASEVTVSVRKTRPPIDADLDSVGVTLSRRSSN